MKRLHVHVAVENLEASVRFYSHLFAAEPTVLKTDYAKWMLEDPRVNFAISARGAAAGIQHLGIQVEDRGELEEVYGRLKRADRPVLEEGLTTCCYAQSEKSWIEDPQGRQVGDLPYDGHRRNFGFQRLFGVDTTELALRSGLLTTDKASVAGRLVRVLNVTPGLNLQLRALRRAGIEVMPRCIDAEGTRATLADGSQHDVDAVIFAMGYEDDTTWVDILEATEGERFLEQRGISPVPRLCHVGRDWQTSRASGLVCGVAYDAETIGAHLTKGMGSLDA